MRRRVGIRASLAALLALLVVAPPAAAEPITGGQTKLALAPSLHRALQMEGVRLAGLSAVKANGRFATLPIGSGLLEGTHGSGYLFYEGGIRLQLRKRRAVLRGLVVNTSKRWLRAKLGGKELTIATVDATRAGWNGFEIETSFALRLTGRAAKLLNDRLGLAGAFRGGRPLATAETVARPEVVAVDGGTIDLRFDPGFRAKLAALEIEVSSAEFTPYGGSPQEGLSLPIRHGSIAPDLSLGALVGEAGFALLQKGIVPRLARFTGIGLSLDSDRLNASINSDAGRFGASLLASVDFGTVAAQADPATGTVTAPPVTAHLDPAVATLLNDTFVPGGPPVFNGGEPLAAVSFSVNTR